MNRLFAPFILFTFLTFSSNANAGRVAIDHIVFELNKLDVQNFAIAIWDQREMVVDKSQPESFLGYVRSITGIAYGHITKSKQSLTKILSGKIQQAYQAKGMVVGSIETSPFENEKDLIHKVTKTNYDRVLVLKLSNFIFDGVTKVEYVVDIETIIYSKTGEKLYTNNVSSQTPMGSSGRIKKTVPANIKSILEGILNNLVLKEAIEKEYGSPQKEVKLDQIITTDGDELSVKVVEITETSIKYRSASQLDGPIRNISIEQVFMIKYSDGAKELFNKK